MHVRSLSKTVAATAKSRFHAAGPARPTHRWSFGTPSLPRGISTLTGARERASSTLRTFETAARTAGSLSPAARGSRFFSSVSRKARSGPDDSAARETATEASREWIEAEIDRMAEQVAGHPVLSHRFLQLLEELSMPGRGYTPAQIDVITLNYFRACLEVIPAIVGGIQLALRRGDAFALAKLSENLNEETGDGDVGQGHRQLALDSLNAIRSLHGCSDLSVEGTYRSHILLPEVGEFIAALEQFHARASDQAALGATYADERVSLPMMTRYMNTFIEPFKPCFAPGEWSAVVKYWELHTGGMEERHAQDLLASLKEACRTREDVAQASEGAMAFLRLQTRMLDAVYRAVMAAGEHGGGPLPIPDEPPAEISATAVFHLQIN